MSVIFGTNNVNNIYRKGAKLQPKKTDILVPHFLYTYINKNEKSGGAIKWKFTLLFAENANNRVSYWNQIDLINLV